MRNESRNMRYRSPCVFRASRFCNRVRYRCVGIYIILSVSLFIIGLGPSLSIWFSNAKRKPESIFDVHHVNGAFVFGLPASLLSTAFLL
ncbi:hypothetical protein F5887DRAFT_1002725, partial [Amanita rubescens]